MRVLLGAFGDPGHAFPMLALGSALVGRGHTVLVQTWARWEADARAAGMAFAAAPEYPVFPTRGSPLPPSVATLRAARETVPVVREWRPDVAVADVLTNAPALAAEVCDVPWATLVPHLLPTGAPGFPPFGLGAKLPRTAAGARLWDAFDDVVVRGLRIGRRELNACRVALGLAPLPWLHTGLSRSLTIVATLPALEYPRDWPGWTVRTGPLLWSAPRTSPDPSESPAPDPSAAPAHATPGPSAAPALAAPHPPVTPAHATPGPSAAPAFALPVAGGRDVAPVVLVAPSTAQDREHRLLRAAIRGLASAPVRVVAVGPRGVLGDAPLPENVTLVDWLDYAAAMPAADLVVCHGGLGTLARALVSGRPLVVCAAAGDMGENAARAAWAGVGRRLPLRACTPRTLRRTVIGALADPSLRARAETIAGDPASRSGAADAATALERWASGLQLGGRDSNPQPFG